MHSSMLAGLARYQRTGEMHFLTFHCYRRLRYPGGTEAIAFSLFM
jgi:hypothetical protein